MLSNEFKPIPFIRKLCAHKTEKEILEAEENFKEYLMFINKVFNRLEREKGTHGVSQNITNPNQHI